MLPMVIRSRIFGLTLLCFSLSATFSAQNQPIDLDLTVHEWGTFTSIAGGDGLAEKWSTLNGSAVLPHFVDHVSGPQAKAGLLGTARMETPVLYFYSPHEVTVSVKVKFSKGLITEWYPQASRVKPDPEKVLDREALYRRHGGGSIAWDSVTVSPNLAPGFPRENEGNQYYAARKTSAAPLVVKTAAGDQQERFLFYRGVSTFSVPISATVTPEGNLRIKNLAQEEISSVILFERRGDKVGYRIGGGLQSEMSLDPPELTATFDSMGRDLQDILTAQGLYPDEAHAMIETWRQSWFEEGSRLFYVVPHDFLNVQVIHAEGVKIARQSAPKSMPAAPRDLCLLQRRADSPRGNVLQVERIPFQFRSRKNKTLSRETVALFFEMLCECFDNRHGALARFGLAAFLDHRRTPRRAPHTDLAVLDIAPLQALNLTLPQPRESSHGDNPRRGAHHCCLLLVLLIAVI